MKKYSYNGKILIFILLLFPVLIKSQDIIKPEIILLNFRSNHKVYIYSSPEKDSIIATVQDDDKNQNYYEFEVSEKKDNMIKVIAVNIRNNKKIKGWISIYDTGIYTRTYGDGMYPLYEYPDFNSKIILKIYDKSGTLLQVIDIKNNWLKVRTKFRNKIYEYWLPDKYQCPTVYNSCT